MSSRSSRFRWIGERRGNRVGPIDRSDLRAFRAIGIVLLLVAMVVTAIFGINFDVAAYTTFRGELRTARGTVTDVQSTGWHEPGTNPRHRGEQSEIVAVSYEYTDPAGVKRAGVSYGPGSRLTPGTQVTIEYPVGQQDISRIRGYRCARFDRIPAALWILVGTGVVLLAVGMLHPLRRRRSARSDD